MADRKPIAPEPQEIPAVSLFGDVRVQPTDEDEDTDGPTIFNTINALSEKRPLNYQADIVNRNFPYIPFMVNRAFSLSEDGVLAAAEMNQRSHLPHEVQVSFYVHSLRSRRRFAKWPKKLKDDPEVLLLAQYYGMSKREAKLHRHLHTVEELKTMTKTLRDGARSSRSTVS